MATKLARPLWHPTPDQWRTISRAARQGRKHAELWAELFDNAPAGSEAVLPQTFGQVDGRLPSLSFDEALDCLEDFLELEAGRPQAGVLLYPVAWDVVAAARYPGRDHATILPQLVRGGLLVEGKDISYSGVLWPLAVQPALVTAIRHRRVARSAPAFARLEAKLADIQGTFPNLIRLFIGVVVGGLVYKLIYWAIDLWFGV